jgi:AmmeMemoRadiSam system protein A
MIPLESLAEPLTQIARRAIHAWISQGERIEARCPGAPSAGVFVTLRNADGSLRGCIGSLSPIESDVAAETARSAILAASRDPRFEPVRTEELEELRIEVSVLLPAEPVTGLSELDPQRYGVVVRDAGGRQGLLLPQVPGIDSAAMQVEIARRKAGLALDTPISLRRFEVIKFV